MSEEIVFRVLPETNGRWCVVSNDRLNDEVIDGRFGMWSEPIIGWVVMIWKKRDEMEYIHLEPIVSDTCDSPFQEREEPYENPFVVLNKHQSRDSNAAKNGIRFIGTEEECKQLVKQTGKAINSGLHNFSDTILSTWFGK